MLEDYFHHLSFILRRFFFSFYSIEMKKKLVAVFVFDALVSIGIILPNMICLAS
jgi:hypothetical protein